MKLQDLAPIGILLVIVGITLGVGAEILKDIKEGQATTSSATNETVTVATGTGSTANWATGTDPTACANATAAVPAGVGLAIPGACNISVGGTLSVADLTATSINLSYSYYVEDTFWAATENATLGIGKLASWIPTMGLVIAAAIVIGIVVTAFAGKSSAGV